MQENLLKIIAACNASNNAALPQIFLCHILRTVSKDIPSFSMFLQVIAISHYLPFKFLHAFIDLMKDAAV